MRTFSYTIEQDEDPRNPRKEFDCYVGRIICWHRRYNLSDDGEPEKFPTPERFEEWRTQQKPGEPLDPEARGLLLLPLYLYDHSGITISTGPFSCPHDSGQVGYIYATAEAIAKAWGTERDEERAKQGKRLRRKLYKKAEEALRAEIEEFDQYLTGDVYGYVLRDDTGEVVDSCWGFYGHKHAEVEAKGAKEYAEQEEQKNADREQFADYRAGGA